MARFAGTGGIDAFNVNGTRANQHEFTIDGASNVDTGNNGGTHVTLNPDAIAEVKVLTSNYQAESFSGVRNITGSWSRAEV